MTARAAAYGNQTINTGFQRPSIYAIKLGGQGELPKTDLVWETRKNVPLPPSMLLVGEDLYVISDGGIFTCLEAKTGKESRAAVLGWIFFDWAAQPYFTLITTFIFAPYFANYVAPDPATGQSLWGFATAASGLMIALASPVLGAVADASGRRKPWIALFGAMLVIGSSLMWFGRPGDVAGIAPLLMAYVLATIGVEFATVFNNAMMPNLVPPEKIGRLPGTGWATGYVGGILSLVLVLGFLAANLNGYSAAMFFTVAYVMTTLASFGMIMLLSRQGFEADALADFAGLNQRSPWWAFVMLIVMFFVADASEPKFAVPPSSRSWKASPRGSPYPVYAAMISGPAPARAAPMAAVGAASNRPCNASPCRRARTRRCAPCC